MRNIDIDADTPVAETPISRQCLRCDSTFVSTWAGHRICNRCKHTSAWRQGDPAPRHSSDGRR